MAAKIPAAAIDRLAPKGSPHKELFSVEDTIRQEIVRHILLLLDYQHYGVKGLISSLETLLNLCKRAAADEQRRKVNKAKLYVKLEGDCKFELAEYVLAAAGWRRKTVDCSAHWVYDPSDPAAADAPLRLRVATEQLQSDLDMLREKQRKRGYSSMLEKQQEENHKASLLAQIQGDRQGRREASKLLSSPQPG